MMKRQPEPELMDTEAQASAYAAADFEESHNNFVKLLTERWGVASLEGYALDLGCGPADVTIRFARAFPGVMVHGVDGAEAMLDYGRRRIEREEGVNGRIELFNGYLPDERLPRDKYDLIISNSLLHHLSDPQTLWEAVKRYAQQGARIFIMDLRRPESTEEAARIVESYSGGEPEILRQDFYNSLLAAYEAGEIRSQLEEARLADLHVEEIGDRHLIVHGRYN